MYKRIFYTICPVCAKSFTGMQIKRKTWGIIQTEIQCPFCKSELTIDKQSLKRSRILVFLLLFSLIMILFVLALGSTYEIIAVIVTFMTIGYAVYITYNLKWYQKNNKNDT